MNKKIIALTILVILTSLGIIIIINNKNKSYEILDNNHGQYAFFYQNDTGEYEKSLDTKWSSGDYILNISESICDGEKNPSFLSWNNDNKSVTLKRNKSTKCTLYFDKVIKIEYIEDLVDLSLKVNSGETYAGKTIVLTRDLDFQNSHGNDYKNKDNKEYNDFNNDDISDKTIYEELTQEDGFGFLPIGNDTYSFEGIFDGNNHTISNLYINNINNLSRLGLFGAIKNSTIKNLVVGGNIKSNVTADMGGIIAIGTNFIIENCVNEVVMESGFDNTYSIGGIVASVGGNDNVIKNCKNKANFTLNGGNNLGGLVGCINISGNSLTIENSYNYGNIISTTADNFGGLIGKDSDINDITIILNSRNYGDLEVNSDDTSKQIGGLMGKVSGLAEIEKSSNKGKIGVISSDSVMVGGLVGRSYKMLIIRNSYNLGEINANSKTSSMKKFGGLIGRKESGDIILYNSYNGGTIKVNSDTLSRLYIGGLIGDLRYGKTWILNCYNKGQIIHEDKSTYTRNGGLIGESYDNADIYIINSYNSGNMSVSAAGNVSAGIIFDNSNIDDPNDRLYFNNVFNIGSLSNNAYQIYRTLSLDETKMAQVSFKNTYYMQGLSATNRNDIEFDALLESDFKSINFLNILNENKNKINLSEYGEEIKDYELVNWIQGIDGYPTLEGVGDYYYQADNVNYVRDLSGNENNGILYNIPKIDNEGITTSDDNTTGYVDCGLIDHDFKDRVTLIVRVRINKFIDNNLHQRMFGDWHSSGTLLAVVNTNVPYMASWTNEYGNRHNSSNFNLQLGQWYTIVGTFDKNGEKIYIDGNLLSTLNFSNETIKISNKHFLLGKGTIGSEDGSDRTYATYSDALIYDRALSEEEIKENFSQEINNINKDKLLLWYKFA